MSQIDHRIPYEISGEDQRSEFMLLCRSCNRAKAWECQHCPNWIDQQDSEICLSCYWCHPEQYQHVALRPIRRLDLTWNEHEIGAYERLRQQAAAHGMSPPAYIKWILGQSPDE